MIKYVLTDEIKAYPGRTLHRIKCVTAFSNVKAGEPGGWVESENNLSQSGDAWVYDNAKVYGNAKVYDNAKVYGNAKVFGDAQVYDNAKVFGNAEVYGDAKVYDNAWVYGNAEVYGNADVYDNAVVKETSDYAVYKNTWSSRRYFTWTRSNNMWKVGWFYGSGEELIAKAYKDSKLSGDCYKAFVKLREKLNKLEKMK